MRMSDSCFIESVLHCLRENTNGLQGIVTVCRKTVAIPHNDLSSLYKVRCLKKAQSLLAFLAAPISVEICKDKMFDKQAYFVPAAMGFLKASMRSYMLVF